MDSEKKDVRKVVENNEATLESILAFRDKVPVEKYEIIGAGIIYIHGLTGAEKANWQKECQNKDGTVNSAMVESLMFQLCVRDKDGNKLYKFGDVPKLRQLPAAMLGQVTDICMRLSGMGADADAAILKNLQDEEA